MEETSTVEQPIGDNGIANFDHDAGEWRDPKKTLAGTRLISNRNLLHNDYSSPLIFANCLHDSASRTSS
jgi:hypothetical protein